MNLYKNMNAETLEAEYNLAARRDADARLAHSDNVIERWLQRSVAHRKASNAQLDVAYGNGEREKLDYFYSGEANGPLLFFIHGGYWQRGDKSIYSFISEAFTQNGISVAVINYNLTPSVRMGQIPPQICKALAWCYNNANELKFDRDQMHISGHSAGGHLTAMMMATDWPAFDNRLPLDLLKTAIPISGVFELQPIVHTSLNAGPQMNVEEALAQSPMFIPLQSNAPQLVVYGAGETSEFYRQSNAYAEKFSTQDRQITIYEIPICDHFDELEQLADDESVVFKKMHTLITTQQM